MDYFTKLIHTGVDIGIKSQATPAIRITESVIRPLYIDSKLNLTAVHNKCKQARRLYIENSILWFRFIK